MTTASVTLTQLEIGASTAAFDTNLLVVGKAGPTPAQPCCKSADHECPPTDTASDPVWSKVGFDLPDAGWFQYTYESTDGKTAIATAVGDLDCDGKPITFELTLTIGGDGKVNSSLVEPRLEDD
jgi:hypothetical protein